MCKKSGTKKINVNLVTPGLDPELPSVTKELELSTNGLKEKLSELLAFENIQASEIKS